MTGRSAAPPATAPPASTSVSTATAGHQVSNNHDIEEPAAPNQPPFATSYIRFFQPCSSADIIATQGRCLRAGYDSPAVEGLGHYKDFAWKLSIALRLLSEKDRPRRKIYGDEADDSRLGHTPPETRARFNSDEHEMIRFLMRYQEPTTPGSTPALEQEMYDFSSSSSDTSPPIHADCNGLAGQAQLSPASSTSSKKRHLSDDLAIQSPGDDADSGLGEDCRMDHAQKRHRKDVCARIARAKKGEAGKNGPRKETHRA
ncbi:hypothetical protein SVAN01_04960 [Stagonosporopsis vannaccii]|nr:hypothetical protein SVAN01_04960 [Stagonosporopsis vannaccii]